MTSAPSPTGAPARPRATARLQFHAGFTLDDAAALVDYFADLGISHLYASPLLTARPGSTHGYDTLEYGRINPELGGQAALARLVGRLRARGMGLIVDIVPNHMAVGGSGNAWWDSLLCWGRASPYAHYFDIDWSPPDPALRDRVLLPFLAAPYGDSLAKGELDLRFDPRDGRFSCWHHDHRFPICPNHYAGLFSDGDLPPVAAALLGALRTVPPCAAPAYLAALADWSREAEGARLIGHALARHSAATTAGRARLHALLERQHYRLAWWRTASDLINWRRFFDITGLAGLCVEHPDVFDAVHGTIVALYGQGLIDGVRVDHIDGLTAPGAYCDRLRRALAAVALQRPPDAPPGPAIYVEKILAADEALPASWGVDGTTGYDFLEQVDLLLHDASGGDALNDLWVWSAGGALSFDAEQRAARQSILDRGLAAEYARAVHALAALAASDARTRDFTQAVIARVLRQVLLAFPVYRTYAADAASRLLHDVCRQVRPTLAASQHPLLDWLERQLDGSLLPDTADAIACFEHLTAPLAAKAVEDTAFYRYGRLLSRNDVGTHPGHFAGTPQGFHAACAARRHDWPDAMLATATHDHKRGEDARARLAVLSEPAADWARTAMAWCEHNLPLRRRAYGVPNIHRAGGASNLHRASGASNLHRAHGASGLHAADGTPSFHRADGASIPDRADELILYQALIGAWPLPDAGGASTLPPDFRDRIAAWQTKALREAKRHTDWTDVNQEYEESCSAFLDGLLDAKASHGFPAMMDAFVSRIAPAGALNGLSQTLLRLTAPGMPDLYQGCEFWDFSLVDPDNRRPVDYAARAAALASGADLPELAPHWRDGRIKQRLIAALLRARADHPALFARGSYQPLRVQGVRRHHVLAFARLLDGQALLVLAPRLVLPLAPSPDDLSCPDGTWRSTTLDLSGLPDGQGDRTWGSRTWRSLLRPGAVFDDAALHRLAPLADTLPFDVLLSAS